MHEIWFQISGNILVIPGCSMLGLSKSVCWCNLFAMFANTNSCGTMQPLEYFLPPWVVHMSRCGIPAGYSAYSDRDNGNQTLCFTGNHFRCYAWLDPCIHWALSLSVVQQTGTKHGTAFCVAATGKCIASEAFTMERKQCFISATSAAIVFFSLKTTQSLSGMFINSTKMLLLVLAGP